MSSDQNPPSRIRPLARRLDSLSGSPTSGPARLTPIAQRPLELVSPSAGSKKIAPKQPGVKFEPEVGGVKQESGTSDMSVRDVLAQARRREAEAMAKKEVSAVPARGAGRKPVIRSDIQTSISGEQMTMASGGFLADTTEDIDLEGDQHGVAMVDISSRCYPIKIPFTQTLELHESSSSPSIGQDDLMLVQLPSLFPTLVPYNRTTDESHTPKKRSGSPRVGSSQIANRSIGTSFSDIPDGRIGTLKVLRSGKTIMEIGETRFVVNEGQKVGFRTEVACLCPGESEIIFMGEANKRLVVSPMIV
jgi:hypothetical protein